MLTVVYMYLSCLFCLSFPLEEVSHLEEELAKQDEYIALLEEELTTATEQCKVQGVQLETEHNEKKRLKRTLSELEQDVKTKSEQVVPNRFLPSIVCACLCIEPLFCLTWMGKLYKLVV